MTRPAPDPPPPPVGWAEALERIRERGGRVTHAKRALLQLLYSDSPLTADELVARMGGHDRSVVYRNLTQFEDLGIAEHLHLGHGRAVYRPAGLPTVPVVCNRCGTTYEMDRRHADAFTRRVAEQTGIALDLIHFPLTGPCASCRSG